MIICKSTTMLAEVTARVTSAAETPAYLDATAALKVACSTAPKLARSVASVKDMLSAFRYSSPGPTGGNDGGGEMVGDAAKGGAGGGLTGERSGGG